MPARSIWRGYLRLALVSCPVALWNAKHDRAATRFNQINPKTGHRIRMMTVDAETDEEVQRRDLVKGYEFQKGRYLLLTDEDFDSVKVESSSVMNIEKFVEADSIDPIYFSSSYYLAQTATPGATYMPCSTKASWRLGGLRWREWSSDSVSGQSPSDRCPAGSLPTR